MPVVKEHSTRPLVKDAVVLDLGDLSRQAAHLKEAAQARARQILDEARREAQRITAEADSAGFEQGHAKGLTQGTDEGLAAGHAEALTASQERIAAVTDRLGDLAEHWDARRQEIDREAREAVLRLALAMGRKLVHRLIEIEPGIVADQVGEALGCVLEPTDVHVEINPRDRALLEASLPAMAERFKHLGTVNLVDREAVGRGGCHLQLGSGAVDATIEKQLERIVALIAPPPPPPESQESPESPDSPDSPDPPQHRESPPFHADPPPPLSPPSPPPPGDLTGGAPSGGG